jgi:hypothetical protein
VFPVRYGKTYRVELSFKLKMDNAQNCDSCIEFSYLPLYACEMLG